jgi:hypothetical protein
MRWAEVRVPPVRPDRRTRAVRVATVSIPANLAMAAWKAGLMLVAPSMLLLANVVLSLGIAGAKLLAVRGHRAAVKEGGGAQRHPGSHQHRAYRGAGVVLTMVCALYVVLCLVVLVGGARTDRYDENVAIAIATVAFVELGVALRGIAVARRHDELIVEALTSANLAGALALMVLTQSALMSISSTDDPSRACGLTGALLGSVAAALGVRMLVRARSPVPRRAPAGPQPLDRDESRSCPPPTGHGPAVTAAPRTSGSGAP